MNRTKTSALVFVLVVAISVARCGSGPTTPSTGLQFRGTVYLTTDQGEPALPGVVVAISRGSTALSTLTDEQGRFVISNLSAGTWMVAFRAEGYGERRIWVPITTDTTVNCSFTPPE